MFQPLVEYRAHEHLVCQWFARDAILQDVFSLLVLPVCYQSIGCILDIITSKGSAEFSITVEQSTFADLQFH